MDEDDDERCLEFTPQFCSIDSSLEHMEALIAKCLKVDASAATWDKLSLRRTAIAKLDTKTVHAKDLAKDLARELVRTVPSRRLPH